MPFTDQLSNSRDVLTFRFYGVITEHDMDQYIELRVNYPKQERPVVIFIDACDVEEWEFEVNMDRVTGYAQRLADRYANTGEVIAAVAAGATERTYGYAAVLRTYVGEEYPVEVFQTREAALDCVQRYLDKFAGA